MLPKRLSNVKAIRSFRLSDEADKQYVILEERKMKPQLNKRHLIFQYTIHRLICFLFNIYKLEQDDPIFMKKCCVPMQYLYPWIQSIIVQCRIVRDKNDCSLHETIMTQLIASICITGTQCVNWSFELFTRRWTEFIGDVRVSKMIALYFFIMRCLCKIRSYELLRLNCVSLCESWMDYAISHACNTQLI